MKNKEKASERERQQLQRLLQAIIPYLPQPVVKEQLADPEVGRVKGQYWEGSVLFGDLSGFTALSETLSALGKQGAEEITRIVNDLFEALLEDVERYGGILVKFGGDAITVYFGGQHHAWRAARTGLALQETMGQRFVNLDTRGGFFTLRLRVGVHTGKIFAAQVGYEPGYPLRGMELVVTGADINRVAEAQDHAAPGEVCITTETLAPIAGAAQTAPLAEGLHRLEELSRPSSIPAEWTAETAPPGSLSETPVSQLRQYLKALGPYLAVDLTDERHIDPSDPELRAGLRPVAVLFANFADMSGILGALSSEGSAGVEAATNILNTYYARGQEVIGRYGGTINKVDMYTHGDKLMALFGAPLAHGDDVERAVRAALEMQRVMPEVNRYVEGVLGEMGLTNQPLTQRIGINYGYVVAGNVGSEREGSRREYTVMGDTVNLAARLMAAADEGDVLVSPSVRRQVAGIFKFQDLTPVRVKGKAQPIPVSRPLRPLSASERAAIRRGQRSFVGRTAQLEALKAAARQAMAGRGQVVVILGEAGTGKTRLVEAFQERLSESPSLSRLDSYLTELPSFAQEPYAAIINLLRRLVGLGGQTDEDVGRLREWVETRAPDLIRFLPLLGDLLALPIAHNPVTASLTVEQRHNRLLELVEALLYNDAARRPLALVIDDLQWVDESSLALLERLAQGLAEVPLLLLLCYRPEVSFPTPWTALPYAQVLNVTEFSAQESRQLVAELLETEQLPQDLVDMVWNRAEGHPFFTEEFVKSLRETGAIARQDGHWELTVSETAATSIPDTIEGIVLARLDRLEARCRDVLQAASVAAISQARFSQPLLARVDTHPVELPERLNSLVNDGLLEMLESELEALEYHFRHTLTRDVAYDSLLYARRRELHRLIAQAIDVLYADRLDEYVTSLAHHYREAEAWASAFRYQHRAGERAQILFANKDAITYFRRALTIAEDQFPDVLAALGAEELGQALTDVHERLGDVLLLEGRYEEALAAYEAARNLLTGEDRHVTLARFHRKTAEVHERRADYPLALAWLERGLEVLGDREAVEKARIYNFGGGVFYRQGEREKALEWRQRALRIAQRLGDQSEVANAYLIMAIIYFDWGKVDQALDFGRRCLAAYQAAEDLAGSVKARLNLGVISRRADQWDQAVEHFREGLRLSEMMGDAMRVGQFANNMGGVYLDQGKLEQAAAAYQRSIAVLEPIGLWGDVTAVRINLGKVAINQGDLVAGEAHLNDALTLAQEIGARLRLPEIYHWQALLHLARDQQAQALALAQQAHDLAGELQDRVEEGGSLRALGRVYAAMGQPEKAVEHLEASLDRFTELKSLYQTAKTCFQLALVYQEDLEKSAEGRELLDRARELFAQLGAQRDLAQVIAHESELPSDSRTAGGTDEVF